jgi:hypothetical protein
MTNEEKAIDSGLADSFKNLGQSLQGAFKASAPAFAELSKSLQAASDSLAEVMAEEQKRRDALRTAVLDAIGQGLPEAAAARDAGVTRKTVRAWVGKPTRGDLVTAEPYYDTDPDDRAYCGPVTGEYLPRTDFPDAAPPADAAWIDDGSESGPQMVKASTIRVLPKTTA